MWTQEVTPPVMTHPIYDRWLASDGVEADERVCDLRRWIAAQLRPVMAPPPPPPATAVSPQPQPQEPHAEDDQDDQDDDAADDGDEVECDDEEESREDGEEDEESEPDDTTSEDEEADQRHGQESKRGAKKGSAKRKDDPEWQVQMAALRLASALMVLCTDEHAHVLLDSSATTASSSSPGSAARSHSGSKRTSSKSGSGAAHAEAAAGMLDVLHRVLAFPAARNSEHAHDPELEFKRSRLRTEAMNSLAVACFVVDDAKLTRDTCATIAKLYLDDIRPPHAVEDRHLWDADDEDDGDEADADADEDDDDDEDSSDDSTGAESDDESDDGVSEQAAAAKQDGLKRRDAECAAALNVLVFLLGLDESDDEVRKFIASHTEALISLFFAKNSSDIVGPSLHTHHRTRTHARTHTHAARFCVTS
jgi:hypothetical protein